MAGHPGPFELIDLEQANNAAELVNSRSPKMRRDGPDIRVDASEKALATAPGSPVGRGANAVKRVEPFQHVDAMKVSARLLKNALFDPNSIDLDDRNPRESAVTTNLIPTALDRYLTSGPRLGDRAAHPSHDGRIRKGLNRESEPGDLSRMFQQNTLKAASVPSLPVSPQDDAAATEMKVDDPMEETRHHLVTDAKINRSPHGGTAMKGGSFISRFLRAAYGR